MTTLTLTFRALALSLLTLTGAGTQASAATVAAFEKMTNDGVFALNAAQITYFGVKDATHVGFFRPRTKTANTLFAVGTIFNAQSLIGSCRSDCAGILSVRNGDSSDLTYTGGILAALTTATVKTATNRYDRGIAFFFRSSATINFSGGGNFNAGQSRGTLDFAVPAEVPLPASLPLLAGALGLVTLARRRRG